MASSINTNIAAYFAQANITSASNLAQSSVARLSSGNRIVVASDDVAALATGTSLATQVNVLKTALGTASQGSSLLQVADGALSQIQAILQQQQSIALQAKSGALTNTDRGFLNQQFQALTDEINLLANGTTFNGVQLIDGSISGGTSLNTNVTDGSEIVPLSAAIGTVGTMVSGDTFTLTVGGMPTQTFTFGTASGNVGIGATAADSAANLAAAINNSGLSQLANVRIVATSTALTAFYTGSATSLSNIPTIVSGQTGGNITSTGTAAFTGGTSLATITGTINAGDTFTLGSHTIEFVASGATGAQVNIGGSNTVTLASLASYFNTNAGTTGFEDIANIAFTSDSNELFGVYSGGGESQPVLTSSYDVADPITYLGGAQGVNAAQAVVTLSTSSLTVGASTLTIGGQAFTFQSGATAGNAIQYTGGTGNSITAALADIVSVLNTNSATLTGNYANAVFSSDATRIYATNPNTTAITNLTAATLNTVGSVGATFNNGVAIPSAKQSLFTLTAGNIVAAETFTINGVNAVADTQFLVGATDEDTLLNLANYFNSVAGQAALAGAGTPLTNLTFTSDATHLYATNTATTNGSNTNSVTVNYAGAATVTEYNGGAAAVIEDGINSIITTSALIGAGTTLTIGNQTVTFGASGSGANVTIGTSGTLATDRATTLTNLAAYLNSITGSISTNGFVNNLTYSADSTNLYVKNDVSTAAVTPLAVAFNAGTPQSLVTNTSLAAPAHIGTFGGSSAIVAGDTITITGAAGAAQTFTFIAGASSGLNVQVGGSLAATLANLVTQANANVTLGTTNSLHFSTDGVDIFAQNENAGATSTVTTSFTSVGTATFTGVTNATVAADSVSGLGAGVTSAVGTPTGSLFVTSTGTTATNHGTAVDLSEVANNAAFLGAFGGSGTIGAITANYVNTGTVSTSGVQFSVVVGDNTYTTNTVTNASIASTTAPVTLTFTGANNTTSAAEGGSFTLTLRPQSNVTSQNQADQLATGINAALSEVSAYQNRNVLSYNNNYTASVGGTQIATLQGSSLAFNANDFSNASISAVSVSTPATGSTDAIITMTVNGQTFSTVSGIGDTFAANEQIVLVNQSDPNEQITLTFGASGSADLSSESNAAAFQEALSSALGLGDVSGGLTFQLGTTSGSNVNVRIASAQASALFGGETLNISTQDGASAAADTVSDAVNSVTSLRAGVGALLSQFNFASAALQSAVQNQDAARGALLDTDIATESTIYATQQVKLQAGISVLAQANQQLQALLKLIG